MEIEDIKFTSTPRENNNSNNKNIDDFILGRLLGEGAYSQVRLIKNKLNHKKYAVKIMDKQFFKKVFLLKFIFFILILIGKKSSLCTN